MNAQREISLYALGTQSGLLARVFFLSREQKIFALPERDIVAELASTLTVLLLEDATQAGRIPSDLSCLLAYPEQTETDTEQHTEGKNMKIDTRELLEQSFDLAQRVQCDCVCRA